MEFLIDIFSFTQCFDDLFHVGFVVVIRCFGQRFLCKSKRFFVICQGGISPCHTHTGGKLIGVLVIIQFKRFKRFFIFFLRQQLSPIIMHFIDLA